MSPDTDASIEPARSPVNEPYTPATQDGLDGDGSLLAPVFEQVGGRCLVLGSVSAEWHRTLAGLTDHLVQCDIDGDIASPVSASSMDTVVASCRSGTLAAMATAGEHALRRDGMLLLAIDGWPHHLRTEHRSLTGVVADLPRRNALAIRRTLRKAGFGEIVLYGVYPSISEPAFIYPLSNDDVITWFVENHFSVAMRRAMRASHALGVFGAAQPGYLAVCRGTENDVRPDSSLARLTYNRVLTFELENGRLARVTKAPRPGAGEAMNRREQHILDALLASDVPGDVADTLPVGSLTSSPTGATRLESAATGTPLGEHLESDPAALRDVLDVAFDWLARFQEAYRGDRVVRHTDELTERARCPELGVTDPPALDEPVLSFESPCHGDFHIWNVFVDEAGVSEVIDWEYAIDKGDPALDAARFLLFACTEIGDDFETGFEMLCASDTAYAMQVREALDEYYDGVGLARRAVVGAFPYVYPHILGSLRELGEPPAYTALSSTFESRYEVVVENFDESVEILA